MSLEGHQHKLDIHTEADFIIQLTDKNDIGCKIVFSHLRDTSDKISYIFNDVTVDLYLYREEQPPIVVPNKGDKKRYEINNFLKGIIPSSSLGQGVKFWQDYLSSFSNKKVSYTNAIESLLTTKAIEQIYTF